MRIGGFFIALAGVLGIVAILLVHDGRDVELGVRLAIMACWALVFGGVASCLEPNR